MAKYFSALYKLTTGDPKIRLEILRQVAKLIYPTYRFKWPQLDWWNNDDFNHYLEKFNEKAGMNSDRHWMLKQLLRLTSSVPGDTVECGVYLGASSYLICKSNEASENYNRYHFIFDSFEGLSIPSENDGQHWNEGDLSASIEEVKRYLSDFSNVEFLKGWIPSRFTELADHTFSFVHIDVDLFQPTLDSMEFFYPRMNTGGIILCDDYGFSTCTGATKAIDGYLEDKSEKMISLCSGGGFIIKGCDSQG